MKIKSTRYANYFPKIEATKVLFFLKLKIESFQKTKIHQLCKLLLKTNPIKLLLFPSDSSLLDV